MPHTLSKMALPGLPYLKCYHARLFTLSCYSDSGFEEREEIHRSSKSIFSLNIIAKHLSYLLLTVFMMAMGKYKP